MNRRRLAILIEPDSIDLIQIEQGAVACRHCEPLRCEDERESWTGAVRAAARELREVVRQWGVGGHAARVLYDGPTLRSDLADFAVRAPGQACAAARLAILESMAVPPERAVSGAVWLGRDAAGAPPRHHVVVAADADDALRAVEDLVTGAGLRFQSATPMDACLIARLVRAALASPTADRAQLYIGYRSSYLCIIADGRISLARKINLGIDSFITALQRPLRLDGRAEPVTLDRRTAERIVLEHGFPDAELIVDPERGLRGGQLHPLLQPVLQRLMIEIRQSLRFGASESKHDEAPVECTGPGCELPGLAAEIEAALGVALHRATRKAEAPATGGPDRRVLEALSDESFLDAMNLQPARLVQQRATRRMQWWLWTGAAAAIVLITVDAIRWSARLNDVERRVDTIVAQSADLEALRRTSERMSVVIQEVTELEHDIQARAVRPVDFHAVLGELSRLTPKSIRFTSVSFRRVDGRTTGLLVGLARARPGESENDSNVRRFVSELHAHPFFRDVTLGAVTRGLIEESPGERFEVRFAVAPAPAFDVAEQVRATVEVQP